jgi:hypothetical protein
LFLSQPGSSNTSAIFCLSEVDMARFPEDLGHPAFAGTMPAPAPRKRPLESAT